MFGDPEAMVAEPLALDRQLDRGTEAVRSSGALGDGGLIEYAESHVDRKVRR